MELYKERDECCRRSVCCFGTASKFMALFRVLRKEELFLTETFLWLITWNIYIHTFSSLCLTETVPYLFHRKLIGHETITLKMKNMMYMFPIMIIFISYKMPREVYSFLAHIITCRSYPADIL